MSDDTGTAWVEVRQFQTLSEAEQHALALVAVGIDCWIAPRAGSVGLLVAAASEGQARQELAAYARDNRVSAPPALPARPLTEGLVGALVYCCALLFIHGAAGRQALSRDWLSAGEANDGLIVSGEWWRALTALGLHADYGHLFSNMVAGGFLGIILAQMLGGGLTWLAIVLAGGIGNAANALIQPPTHVAIGASTAVFGAVGLLAVLMWRYQTVAWGRGLRRWFPLAVGVMLLAFLGVEGERIDVGAHIAGLLAGMLLGACLVAVGAPLATARGSVQYVCGAGALALFVGAWLIALNGAAP